MEPRFAFLCENSTDFIGIWEADLSLAFLNHTGRELVGLGSEAERGRTTLGDFFFPEDAHLVENRLVSQTFEQGHAEVEVRIRHFQTSEPIWTAFHAIAMHDNHGRVDGLAAIARDVTRQRQTLDRLRESEQRFRTLASHAPVGIFQSNAQGETVFVNEQWCAMSGLTPAEAIGNGWMNAVHPDDREWALAGWAAAVRQGHTSEAEFRFLRPDGRVTWLLGNAVPLHDPHGRLAGFIGSVLDITERKQTEGQLREATRVAETLHRVGGTMAAKLDLQNVVQFVTDESTELAGAEFGAFFYNAVDDRGESYRLFTLSGAPREAFEHFPMPRNTTLFSTTFRGDGVVRVDDVTKHPCFGRNPPFNGFPQGHLPVRSYMAAPVVSGTGEVLGGLFLGHAEVGVFTENHQRLITGIATLAATAIENARLYGQIREADQRKDQFLATLAHELRNPLAPLRTGLQILRQANSSDRQFVHARDMMDRQVQQMVRLIDDLLDVSRISRGKVQLRKQVVDLADVVAAAVETSRPLITHSGHRLIVDLPQDSIPVEADVTRLAQVFSNLLNNAAKYTERGGRIRLSVEHARNAGVVRVEDTGIGIPASMLRQIFELFSQVDQSLERAQGGLGIGLTIVHQLVDLHGGTIVARSGGRGQGSTFTVRLPKASASRDTRSHSENPRQSNMTTIKKRVLVVDDNRDAATSLTMLLKLMGNEVHIAYDGEEGIQIADDVRPDLILMDIGMPRLNGLDAARRIREQPWGQETVLVALTGWGQAEDRSQTKAAGFDHHLVKPVKTESLRELLSGDARPA